MKLEDINDYGKAPNCVWGLFLYGIIMSETGHIHSERGNKEKRKEHIKLDGRSEKPAK